VKKYFNLFFSIFAMLCNFICFWYSDVLFDRYFVFGFIPLALSILVLLAILICSIIFIVRHRFVATNYVSLAISLVTLVVILFFPFRSAKVNLELELYEKDRLEIVEMVKNNDIVESLGDVKLPKGYGKLSSDGNIYIYQKDSEQVISFWVFRGFLSGSVELIYSSKDEALIYKNETGHPITSVIKLKEHWFLVETDY